MRRINVSLDSLDAEKFRKLTRRGDLEVVLGGIAAAPSRRRVRLNAVALKGVNEDEIFALVDFAHGRGMDITFIEVMPLGDIDGLRIDQYWPLSAVRARLAERYTLDASSHRTGGPARYDRVRETGGRIGFITPLTHNFCESCNRVRVTCTGTLYMCLGQEDAADLPRAAARQRERRIAASRHRRGDRAQAQGHDFIIDRETRAPAVPRHMSMTGG